MATYKVIQDIEAEDKLLGPLSLRQFIYAAIALVTAFLAWRIAMVQILVAIPLILPVAFFGLLAAPLGANQSSEIWLLAKIRFFVKPQRRIWDQTGMQELVTITAPKREEKHLTKELSQTEVRSRLKALATTIDSRGWAIKNVDVNLYAQPGYLTGQATSDRLIDMSSMPQEVSSAYVTPQDDILDTSNNPTAQHLDQMISASSQSHRQQIVEQMRQSASGQVSDGAPPDYWFMNQVPQAAPGQAVFSRANMVSPATGQPATRKAAPTDEEKALLDKIRQEKEHDSHTYGHLKTIKPPEHGKAKHHQPDHVVKAEPQPAAGQAPSGKTPDPAIINLANNDDLDVATIARQAKKERGQADDEVVINLH